MTLHSKKNIFTISGSCKPLNGGECRRLLDLIRQNVDTLTTKFFEEFSHVSKFFDLVKNCEIFALFGVRFSVILESFVVLIVVTWLVVQVSMGLSSCVGFLEV